MTIVQIKRLLHRCLTTRRAHSVRCLVRRAQQLSVL